MKKGRNSELVKYATYAGVSPCVIYLQAVMVGRDALLVVGSLVYRYKTRRTEDAFFDLDSLDYKVTPSTLSKARNAAPAAAEGRTPYVVAVSSLFMLPPQQLCRRVQPVERKVNGSPM